MADPVTTIAVTQVIENLVVCLTAHTSMAAVESGAKLLSLLHDRLSGRAKEALSKVEARPSEDNLVNLRHEIIRQIEQEPQLRAELQELLPIPDESRTVRAVGDAIRTGSQNIGGAFIGSRE